MLSHSLSGPSVPVYVLGSQAVFGRIEGYMDYIDPKTKYVFRGIPVNKDPKALLVEQIRAAVLVRRSSI